LAVQRLISSSIRVLIVVSFNNNTCAGIQWVNTPKLAENSEWKVVQKEVPLHCSALATEVVCSGEYDLGMPAGGTFPGRMTIARKR
jgi:hypothetical protein